MYEAIVFLPLIGAFIAGIFGQIIGARASTYVTSGFMVLVAILSAIAFADVGAIVLTLQKRDNPKRQSVAAQNARRRDESVEVVKVKPGQGL